MSDYEKLFALWETITGKDLSKGKNSDKGATPPKPKVDQEVDLNGRIRQGI